MKKLLLLIPLCLNTFASQQPAQTKLAHEATTQISSAQQSNTGATAAQVSNTRTRSHRPTLEDARELKKGLAQTNLVVLHNTCVTVNQSNNQAQEIATLKQQLAPTLARIGILETFCATICTHVKRHEQELAPWRYVEPVAAPYYSEAAHVGYEGATYAAQYEENQFTTPTNKKN